MTLIEGSLWGLVCSRLITYSRRVLNRMCKFKTNLPKQGRLKVHTYTNFQDNPSRHSPSIFPIEYFAKLQIHTRNRIDLWQDYKTENSRYTYIHVLMNTFRGNIISESRTCYFPCEFSAASNSIRHFPNTLLSRYLFCGMRRYRIMYPFFFFAQRRVE